MEINFYKKIQPYFRYMFIMLIGMCMVKTSCAQEDPSNSLYLFNLLNINPAYAGSRGTLSITTGFHKQWVGVPGSPRTSTFSMDAPINEHHLGLGLQLYDNRIGLEHTSGINGSFSTMLNFADDEFLSLGLQGGILNYRIDRTSVALPFQDDPAFQYNTNVMIPTAGAGAYYQRPKFYASLSAPSLLVSTVNLNKIVSVNSPSLKNLQVILTTGIGAQLSDDIELKPSVYLRWMNGKVFDVHVNSSIWYKDLISLGFSYRYNDAILGIFELKINNKLSFGYSYASSIGDRGIFSQGTHEAIIRFDFGPSDN